MEMNPETYQSVNIQEHGIGFYYGLKHLTWENLANADAVYDQALTLVERAHALAHEQLASDPAWARLCVEPREHTRYHVLCTPDDLVDTVQDGVFLASFAFWITLKGYAIDPQAAQRFQAICHQAAQDTFPAPDLVALPARQYTRSEMMEYAELALPA